MTAARPRWSHPRAGRRARRRRTRAQRKPAQLALRCTDGASAHAVERELLGPARASGVGTAALELHRRALAGVELRARTAAARAASATRTRVETGSVGPVRGIGLGDRIGRVGRVHRLTRVWDRELDVGPIRSVRSAVGRLDLTGEAAARIEQRERRGRSHGDEPEPRATSSPRCHELDHSPARGGVRGSPVIRSSRSRRARRRPSAPASTGDTRRSARASARRADGTPRARAMDRTRVSPRRP